MTSTKSLQVEKESKYKKMKSERQRQAEERAGANFDEDLKKFKEAEQTELRRLAKEQERIKELENSSSYNAMKKIKEVMDDYYVDGILGVFGVGDWLVLFLGLPTIFFSLFKLHSIRLTTICMAYFIIDLLVGLVPVLGDICDFFYKGYKKSFVLIDGYIHNDPETMQTLNTKFWSMVLVSLVVIAVLGFIISLIFSILLKFFALIGDQIH